MNYAQGYGQQPQHAPALRYPIDAFVIQPQAVEPGRPPVIPDVSNVPPQLSHYFPFVVSACMDALMARARDNPLRTYLYNQMSANYWNNLEFPAFVDSVLRYLDMRLTKREYPDIQGGAIKAAQEFAELTAAANVALNPQLTAYLNPQMLQGVQQVLAHMDRLRAEMQQFTNAQRQAGFGQQPQLQQPGFGQQQPQQPPMWNQPAPAVWNQPQQPAWSHPTPPAWNQQQPQQPAWRTQPHVTAAVSAVPQAAPLFRTGPEQPAATSSGQYSERYRDYTPPSTFAPVASAEVPSTNAQNIQEMRRQKEQQMMNNVPTQAPAQPAPPVVPALNMVKASEHIVSWKPSQEKPINIAFNPNTSDLYYIVQPDGTTLPHVEPKKASEMDLNKHLIVPSYVTSAPLGVAALDTRVRGFEMDKALATDAISLETVKPLPLNVAYKDETFHAAVCVSELWFHNEISLADMRKREDKVNLYRSCGLLLAPVISKKKNPKPFIDMLANAESFAHACAILQTAHNQLNVGEHEHLEPKMLSFLNKRLTDSVNHFLKKKLGSTVGWMDTFMEDAVKIVEWIEPRCGEGVRKALANNQKTILKNALAYGDAAFEETHNRFYLSEEMIEQLKAETGPKMTVTYFYTYYTLTSLDLFSVELNMELPDLEISAGIFASQTPLLRQIADNVFTHQKALELTFGHHLLQTADGVCLELLQSALCDEIFLVAAV